MKAFGWFVALVMVEAAGCLVVALACDRLGYADAGDAFVRCAAVLAAIGVAFTAVVAVAIGLMKVRARVKAVS